MLGLSNEARLVVELWSSADATLELTDAEAETFFDPLGPLPSYFDDRRSFQRFYLRSKGILQRGETRLGVYTLDISRQGIGFLSPWQLLPREQLRLLMPNGTVYEFRVARCKRLREGCYSCGAIFTATPARKAEAE
jgi:hypothetical protein